MSDVSGADEGGPAIDAGLRVLGLLDAAEASAFDTRAAADPALAAEVSAWERRLSPLTLVVTPIPAPPDLWARITASLGSLPAAPSSSAALKKIRFWRASTGVSLALAAGLAAFALFRPLPTAAPAPDLVAALSPAGAPGPTFLVRAGDGRTLLVRAVATVAPIGSDRDLQLWSLPEGASVPVSLGVLPTGGADIRLANAPTAGTKLLMSLEPKGGSPTGAPTGPVVYGGQLAALR